MIEWLTLAELEQRLSTFRPIGLRLCATIHAITSVDPARTIGRIPEEHVEDGIGSAQAWAGLVDTLPFAVRSRSRAGSGFGLDGYGVEVWFPVRQDGDRVMFEALETLPLPAFQTAFIDSMRPGSFGVVPLGEREPIYTSTSRDDAAAALRFLEGSSCTKYALVQLDSVPEQWFIIGPSAGPYVSRVENARDKSHAERIAATYTRSTGELFTVWRSG
jgi:hypothetical protein